MRSTGFWVASHITGIFEIVDNDDLLLRGSRGAGFNINRGIETRISTNGASETEVFFNGENIPTDETLVTSEVIKLFFEKTGIEETALIINHDFKVPMSAGFGTSAGGALGTALCLKELFKAGLSREEMFRIAHIAETKHWCGLGDILGLYGNQHTEIRVKPGAPEIGETIAFDIDTGTRIFTCSYGKLQTSKVLTHPVHRQKIIERGNMEVEKLLEKPTSDTFMTGCREFSEFVGLYSNEAISTLKTFKEKGLETPAMIMLGDGLFVMTRDEKTLEQLASGEHPFSLFREEQFACETTRRIG
ncbi:MAG: pantoate kinase [Candidatus Hodarchaeales archaeon]